MLNLFAITYISVNELIKVCKISNIITLFASLISPSRVIVTYRSSLTKVRKNFCDLVKQNFKTARPFGDNYRICVLDSY